MADYCYTTIQSETPKNRKPFLSMLSVLLRDYQSHRTYLSQLDESDWENFYPKDNSGINQARLMELFPVGAFKLELDSPWYPKGIDFARELSEAFPALTFEVFTCADAGYYPIKLANEDWAELHLTIQGGKIVKVLGNTETEDAENKWIERDLTSEAAELEFERRGNRKADDH